MNQTQFQLNSKAPSQSDKILEYLKFNMNVGDGWCPMTNLVWTSGSYNVHSRISDLRKRGHKIEHRNEHKEDGTINSFYRLVE